MLCVCVWSPALTHRDITVRARRAVRSVQSLGAALERSLLLCKCMHRLVVFGMPQPDASPHAHRFFPALLQVNSHAAELCDM